MTAQTLINNLLTSNIKMQDQDNKTLSTRLVYAMNILGVNQSELARRIGVKPQVIQYLCTSNATRSKFAFDIADALGLNVDWLIAGQGRMADKISTENIIKVPIVEWSNILDTLKSNYKNSVISEHITTQMNLSEKCYAVRINDCSMIPRFEIGTVLIIDPELQPQENDFVIVSTKSSAIPIVRQLIKRNKRPVLMPLNTTLYKEIELSDDDKILGVLRQTFYEFARS
jgi:SOS-response transcriptional repressor LexA